MLLLLLVRLPTLIPTCTNIGTNTNPNTNTYSITKTTTGTDTDTNAYARTNRNTTKVMGTNNTTIPFTIHTLTDNNRKKNLMRYLYSYNGNTYANANNADTDTQSGTSTNTNTNASTTKQQHCPGQWKKSGSKKLGGSSTISPYLEPQQSDEN